MALIYLTHFSHDISDRYCTQFYLYISCKGGATNLKMGRGVSMHWNVGGQNSKNIKIWKSWGDTGGVWPHPPPSYGGVAPDFMLVL